MSSATSKMTHRETDIVTVAQLNQDILRPERIRIKLNSIVKSLPIDIGSLAYSERGTNDKHIDDRCNPVVEESFIESRRELIRRIMGHLSVMGSHGTIRSECGYFTRVLNWCDANKHSDAFSDVNSAKNKYQCYTQDLNHRIATGKLAPITAAAYQRAFAKLCELCFPDEYRHIVSIAIPIKVSRGDIKSPRAGHVKIYLKTCLALARRLSLFVIDQQKYPCVVELESFEAVIFPSNKGVLTPYLKEELCIYNASERRISTVEEYVKGAAKYGRKIRGGEACRAVDDALININCANSDLRHEYRLRLAALAAKAYACVFLALTGASPTEFAQFDYDEAVEIEKSLVKKEFSAVKFRARGKRTRYAIGRNNGLNLLREYLKLRAWVLNGESFGSLFFSMDRSGGYTGTYSRLSNEFCTTLYRAISGVYLDPMCPNITSRSLRKFKSVSLHELGISPATVADVLNHTISTNVSDYAQANIEQQESEFEGYWQAVRRAAEVVRERASSDALATASGHCNAFNSPTPESEAVTIQPSCKTQYGCLYCTHYICHSDEEDVHKLTSLQYVINAVRDTAPDLQHAEALYRDLSIRIEFILDGIAAHSSASAEMVAAIKHAVHERGELTPFWERRLQRYEKLGVVF